MGRASSDHERENWIIHIVYSHTSPSQTKLTRRAVNNFSAVRGLQAQQWDLCLDMMKWRGKKTKPQNLPSVKGCWSTVRSTGKHHLKTYRVMSFPKDLRKDSGKLSQVFFRCSTSKQILVFLCWDQLLLKCHWWLQSLYGWLAKFDTGFYTPGLAPNTSACLDFISPVPLLEDSNNYDDSPPKASEILMTVFSMENVDTETWSFPQACRPMVCW